MTPLAEARAAAEELVALFKTTDIVKIEIAGSIRRGKPEVKDIEIVVEPYVPTDLFGVADPLAQTKFDALIAREVAAKRILRRFNEQGGAQAYGPKFKALSYKGIPLDLFVVRHPAQWGAVFAIRTGPGDFSKYLVTACRSMGLKCEEGRLVRISDGSVFNTPTEEDFFRACGVPWCPPEQRK
jgi:DNA polymerase/3'-5' exonuclease PolX